MRWDLLRAESSHPLKSCEFNSSGWLVKKGSDAARLEEDLVAHEVDRVVPQFRLPRSELLRVF